MTYCEGMYKGLATQGRNLDHTHKTCHHLLEKDIDFIFLWGRAEEIAKKNMLDHCKKKVQTNALNELFV